MGAQHHHTMLAMLVWLWHCRAHILLRLKPQAMPTVTCQCCWCSLLQPQACTAPPPTALQLSWEPKAAKHPRHSIEGSLCTDDQPTSQQSQCRRVPVLGAWGHGDVQSWPCIPWSHTACSLAAVFSHSKDDMLTLGCAHSFLHSVETSANSLGVKSPLRASSVLRAVFELWEEALSPPCEAGQKLLPLCFETAV